jgi:hypothetical protein
MVIYGFRIRGGRILVMQPEVLFECAKLVREGRYEPSLLATMLETAADYIDHLRDTAARAVTGADRTGYHPHVAEADGKQVLVSIFTDADGSIDGVQLAFREDRYDSWSPPVEAERA